MLRTPDLAANSSENRVSQAEIKVRPLPACPNGTKDRSINNCRDWVDWKPDALARDELRFNVCAAASLAYASGYHIGHSFIERS